MNEQNIRDRVNNSGVVERTADHTSMDAILIQEALMGGTMVTIDPMDETIIDVDPIDKTIYETPVEPNVGSLTALLNLDESEQLHTRWNAIQVGFVDEPRSAVQQADALVSEVIEKITQIFASEHGLLESQWKEGNNVSTEDLRKALQHYRSFFNRLVVPIPS